MMSRPRSSSAPGWTPRGISRSGRRRRPDDRSALEPISVTADYALRAAVLLAIEHPHPVTVETIAESVRVPRKVLSKVMQVLRQANPLNATRGNLGGY